MTRIDITQQLTNREYQLIKLLGEGMTRSEIAEEMAMSVHTYDSYRKNIRLKLKIRNQADWARVLMQVAA
jgi:DNA-binding CsgD family transcriptional regulator